MSGPYPVYQSYTTPTAPNVATAIDVSGVFVAPYIAAMGASGEAVISTIQQQTVTITDINYALTYVADVANSVKLLNAFDVSGHGPDGGYSVRLSNPDALAEVLKVALEAQSLAANGGALKTDVASRIRYLIQADGLVNSVQNIDAALTMTIDTSGGATNAAAEMTDAYAKLIYQQIPKGTQGASGLGLYMDASEEPITPALPLAKGDKVVFVWDIAVDTLSPTYAPGSAQSGETGTSAANVAGNFSGSFSNIVGFTRRLALYVKLTDGTGKFDCASKSEGAAGSRLKNQDGSA